MSEEVKKELIEFQVNNIINSLGLMLDSKEFKILTEQVETIRDEARRELLEEIEELKDRIRDFGLICDNEEWDDYDKVRLIGYRVRELVNEWTILEKELSKKK